MEAALQSDFIRAYIRLFKTPPPKLRMDNSVEDQVGRYKMLLCTSLPATLRALTNVSFGLSHSHLTIIHTLPSPPQARILLLVLVQFHWASHGPTLMGYLDELGALGPSVKAQAEAMELEQDGIRKAIMLHSVLRALVNRKLDNTVAQLTAKSLASSKDVVDPAFEDSLRRLTSATQVLYGSPCVVIQEALSRPPPPPRGMTGAGLRLTQLEGHQKQIARVSTGQA